MQSEQEEQREMRGKRRETLDAGGTQSGGDVD